MFQSSFGIGPRLTALVTHDDITKAVSQSFSSSEIQKHVTSL